MGEWSVILSTNHVSVLSDISLIPQLHWDLSDIYTLTLETAASGFGVIM